MAEVTNLADAYKWNISKLADAFQLHRDTCRKRLNDAGVKPAGKKGNAPVYHLAQAAEAIFAGSSVVQDDTTNPNKMHPKVRLEWYRSETERLRFQESIKELIPSAEHRNNIAVTVKATAGFFDSLPDKMERTRLFTPEQLEAIEKVCDQMRVHLYNELLEVQD